MQPIYTNLVLLLQIRDQLCFNNRYIGPKLSIGNIKNHCFFIGFNMFLTCRLSCNIGPTSGSLVPTWDQLGPTWDQLEPTWSQLGVNLSRPGANLGQLSANLSQLGDLRASKQALGPSQWVQGCTKEAPGRHQGANLEPA